MGQTMLGRRLNQVWRGRKNRKEKEEEDKEVEAKAKLSFPRHETEETDRILEEEK